MAKASAASPGERRGPAVAARSVAKPVKPPAPRAKRQARGKVPKTPAGLVLNASRRQRQAQGKVPKAPAPQAQAPASTPAASEGEARVGPGATSSQRAVASIIQHYRCPITRELAIDPVLAEDGHVYERRALERWLQSEEKSPVTNKPMGTRLVPSVAARQTIEDLLDAGAVDDNAAANFFLARAQVLATRSSNPGPDLGGARRDLARAAGLGGGGRGATAFPLQLRVVDWMAQGVQICSDAAAEDEETQRWMVEAGGAMRFAIGSALTGRLTEWKTLRAGARVRVIGDALELQRLCDRPPPGATEAVKWHPAMQAFAGQVCTIKNMGLPKHMSYALKWAGACYCFPFDAVLLEH